MFVSLIIVLFGNSFIALNNVSTSSWMEELPLINRINIKIDQIHYYQLNAIKLHFEKWMTYDIRFKMICLCIFQNGFVYLCDTVRLMMWSNLTGCHSSGFHSWFALARLCALTETG